jgi:ribosomal protein S18 acetylase RimI-like enzyme
MSREAWQLEPLTRPLVDAELAALLRLDADMPGEPWTPSHWRLELPDKWRWSRVARTGGILMGFLVASKRMGAVHIHRLAVDVTARRRGLARRLVLDLAGSAATAGETAMTLKLRPDNVPARTLYLDLGFRVLPQTDANLVMIAAPADVLESARPTGSRFPAPRQP